MPVKIIYFVHGTTVDNENDVATGQVDGELSSLGVKQSNELPDQIGNVSFDVVFCSDLDRSVNSAEISFGNDYDIIQDRRLRECNYGDLNQAPGDQVNYDEHIKEPFPHGECLRDVEERIEDFLNYLRKNYNGKHIAIVAHRAPQLALEVILNNKSWERAIKNDWRKVGEWQPGWAYKVA
ncbi:MAG: histidine phosphatase family protein [Candidatus Aenigmatarchaeota archaeon]